MMGSPSNQARLPCRKPNRSVYEGLPGPNRPRQVPSSPPRQSHIRPQAISGSTLPPNWSKAMIAATASSTFRLDSRPPFEM